MNHFLEKCLQDETYRQNNNFELIASENYPSSEVIKAMGTIYNNKYAEGYPEEKSIEKFKSIYPGYIHTGKTGRYYGSCENIDMAELFARYMFQEAFNTKYHVNVQPHSGSQANYAAYASVLKPGDKILSPSMDTGHLTHSSSVNFVSRLYNIVTYTINEYGYYDINNIRELALKERPKLILAGASAYPREIDFKSFYDIANEVGAYFMVDMAHIAGLIVARAHNSPFGLADIITTTTHKTLRGPRGGLIFCKPELANKIDFAVFPHTQGGPLPQMILAKGQCAYEATTPDYRNYIWNVIENCEYMADYMKNKGMDLVTNGTDNHLFIVNLSETHPHVTGKELQNELSSIGITLNKEIVPGDKRSPVETSGIRIGTAAETTKMQPKEKFIEIAQKIIDCANKLEEKNKKCN